MVAQEKGQIMEIKVGNYTLRSDKFAMWIEEDYTDKKGKKATRQVAGYCTSLDNLLRDFMEKQINGSDADTLTKLIKAMQKTFYDMQELNEKALKEDFRIIRHIGKEQK